MDEQKPQKSSGVLASLRKKLYQRNNQFEKDWRGELKAHDIDAARQWEPEPEKKTKKIPLVKKIFFAAIAFFVLSAGAAFLVFVMGTNVVSSQNVSIVVSAPTSVEAGQGVTFQVLIENDNDVPLESTDLIITYPEGTRMVGNVEQELKRFRQPLGTIQAHEIMTETLQAIFFGQEGTPQEIQVELEYRVAGSNAIFVNEKVHEVVISSSPITITVDALKEVSSGQEFEMEVQVQSNSTEIVEDILLHIEYPFGFSFTRSTPQPVFDTNNWNIGDLEPGGERMITLRGTVSGQDGEEKVFRIQGGAAAANDTTKVGVVYGSLISLVEIVQPFLGIEFALDGESLESYSVDSGQDIRGTIEWTNNSETKITNARLEARLAGEVLDKGSVVVSNGFFRSIDSTIIWDKNTHVALGSIEPGSTGEATFRFSPQSLFRNGSGVFKNPLIAVTVTASGERLAETGVSENIGNTIARNVKVISDVGFTSRGVYFAGPFTNQGPLPPRVEQETTYTIIWTAVNSSNTISRARVEATLPSYVRWVGVASPTSETVEYNERDRTMNWDIGIIRGGVGVTSPAREVAFQVVLIPSVSHLGQVIELLSEAVFIGNDEFADVEVSREARSITTKLTTDPQFGSGQSVISQ